MTTIGLSETWPNTWPQAGRRTFLARRLVGAVRAVRRVPGALMLGALLLAWAMLRRLLVAIVVVLACAGTPAAAVPIIDLGTFSYTWKQVTTDVIPPAPVFGYDSNLEPYYFGDGNALQSSCFSIVKKVAPIVSQGETVTNLFTTWTIKQTGASRVCSTTFSGINILTSNDPYNASFTIRITNDPLTIQQTVFAAPAGQTTRIAASTIFSDPEGDSPTLITSPVPMGSGPDCGSLTFTASTVAIVPSGAGGVCAVTVNARDSLGAETTANLTINTTVAAPTVTAIAPARGPLTGGNSVIITGTGFTGASAVTIGGAAVAGMRVVSDSSITATTPAGTAGAASVLVTTPGGTNAANTLYTYVPPAPTVTAIAPATGTTAGGTAVTISGTDFTGASAVTIGGTAATDVTVASATSITATTPAGTAGSASVLVTTPGGTNAANTLYSYTTPPSLSTAWVSYNGDDTNSCAITAPCLTFAGALAKVAAGGTIIARDAGDYGAMTITKAITIQGTDRDVNITTSGAAAITIAAGANDIVTLVGLDLNGLNTATTGITIISGGAVYVRDSSIRSFTGAGIAMASNTANAQLFVKDSNILRNGEGVAVTGAGRLASIVNCLIDGNATGINATNAAIVSIAQTVINAGPIGIATSGGAMVVSIGPSSIVSGTGRPTMTVPMY